MATKLPWTWWLRAFRMSQDISGKSNKRKTLYEYVPPKLSEAQRTSRLVAHFGCR
jgi:hypothetical protein